MKKITGVILFLSLTLCVFGKELEGVNLKAVNMVLEANVNANQFDELKDQLNYLDELKTTISSMESQMSDEAKLICKNYIETQKLRLIQADQENQEKEQNLKSNKKAREKESIALAKKLAKEYKDFSNKNKNLSSHFYFRLKEAETEASADQGMLAQLFAAQGMLKEYGRIEKLNPEYGETLITYGLLLYMMPDFMGGNEEEGIEKVKKAIEVSSTNYEKITALTMYSQILFEKGDLEGSSKCLDEIEVVMPGTNLDEIRALNASGKSLFEEDD